MSFDRRPERSAESADDETDSDGDPVDPTAEPDPDGGDASPNANADDGEDDDGPRSNPALNVVNYPLFTPEDGVDREVFGYFWGTVLIANVAVLALSLGPMLLFFRGQWSLGGRLVALGLVLLGWVYYRVATYEGTDDEGDADADGEGGSGGDADDRARNP